MCVALDHLQTTRVSLLIWRPRWLMPEIELDPEAEIKLLTTQAIAIETTASTDNKMFFSCVQFRRSLAVRLSKACTSYKQTS